MATDHHITPEDARAYRKLISTLVGSAVGSCVANYLSDPDWVVKSRTAAQAVLGEIRNIISGDTTPHVLAFLDDRIKRLTTDEALTEMRDMLQDLKASADPTDVRDVVNRMQDVKRRRGY